MQSQHEITHKHRATMSGESRGQGSTGPTQQPPSFVISYRSSNSDSDSDTTERESTFEPTGTAEPKKAAAHAKPAAFRPTLLTSTQSSAARLSSASAATLQPTTSKARANPKSPTLGTEAIRSDEDADADAEAEAEAETEADKQRIKVAHGLLNWRERVGLLRSSSSSASATASGDLHTPLLHAGPSNVPRYDAGPASGLLSDMSLPVNDDSGPSQPPSTDSGISGHRRSGHLPTVLAETLAPAKEAPGLGFLSDDDPRRADSDDLLKGGKIHTQRLMTQLAWLAVAISQGLLFPFFTMGESSPNGSTNSDWYQELHRPPYTPPVEAHYVMLALLCLTQSRAAWLVWRRGGLSRQAAPLFLFFASFSLFQCWTVTFFAYHSAATALFVAFLMVASAFFAYVMFRARLKRAGQLLLPWLAWMIFLTVPTFDILIRN
jgi:benzodiazapine receptor